MTGQPIALAALAGFALGWVVWLAERHLVAQRISINQTGWVLSALIPVTALTLWGGYVGWRWPGLTAGISATVVTALLLCLTRVDLRTRRIPDELVLALLAWAVVQALWLGQPDWGAAALGLLVAGILFFLLALVGRGALGQGDVKLEAALGALLGYPVVLAAMAAGVVAGGLAATFLLLTRRAGRKDTFAYGPYLALGAWLVLARVWGLWPE